MFNDFSPLEELEDLLEDYTLEEILHDNDLTEAQALLLLWRGGHIDLPEKTPISRGTSPPGLAISPENRTEED